LHFYYTLTEISTINIDEMYYHILIIT